MGNMGLMVGIGTPSGGRRKLATPSIMISGAALCARISMAIAATWPVTPGSLSRVADVSGVRRADRMGPKVDTRESVPFSDSRRSMMTRRSGSVKGAEREDVSPAPPSSPRRS